MSADGEIEIAVTAEGADDAAAELAEGDGDAGAGQRQGGGLTNNLRAGAIAGILLSALGPLLEVLDPILKVLQAFLAPVAVMLLSMFQPLIRWLLVQGLPRWMDFLDWAQKTMADWGPLFTAMAAALPGLIPLLLGIEAVDEDIKRWVADVSQKLANLPGWIWGEMNEWATDVRSYLSSLPRRIWTFVQRLPRQIATALTENTGLNFPVISGSQNGDGGLSLQDLRDALSGDGSGGGGGDTTIQFSGGLAAFIDQVEKSSGVDLV